MSEETRRAMKDSNLIKAVGFEAAEQFDAAIESAEHRIAKVIPPAVKYLRNKHSLLTTEQVMTCAGRACLDIGITILARGMKVPDDELDEVASYIRAEFTRVCRFVADDNNGSVK